VVFFLLASCSSAEGPSTDADRDSDVASDVDSGDADGNEDGNFDGGSDVMDGDADLDIDLDIVDADGGSDGDIDSVSDATDSDFDGGADGDLDAHSDAAEGGFDGDLDAALDGSDADDASVETDGDVDTSCGTPRAGAEWHVISSPTSRNLTAISGSHSDNLWAVGDEGTVVHYDGRCWTDIGSPTTYALSGVWTAAPDDVWVVGVDRTRDGVRDKVIASFDGFGWSTHLVAGVGVYSVWGASPDEVYVAGGGSREPMVLGFDGVDWENLHLGPGMAREGLRQLYSLWGSSADNVWTVGWAGGFRHDGAEWRAFLIPAPGIGRRHECSSVWTSGPEDTWIAYRWWYSGGPDRSGWEIAHYDEDGFDLRVESNGIVGLWGSSSCDVWGVGRGGAISRFDGDEWSELHSPVTADLNAVWGDDAGVLWAVGAAGVLLCFGTEDDCAPSSCDVCDAERMLCGGVCVDTTDDPRHCGACEVACPGDDICVEGLCVPS